MYQRFSVDMAGIMDRLWHRRNEGLPSDKQLEADLSDVRTISREVVGSIGAKDDPYTALQCSNF